MRFTSAVSVAGIAVGLASFLIAQALAKGFADEIREKVLANTGHITVTAEGTVRTGPELVAAKILSVEGVTAVEATTFESAAISIGDELNYSILRVVKDETPGFADPDAALPPAERQVPVLVGKRLFDSGAGDSAVDAVLMLRSAEGAPVQRVVNISGSFETGFYEYDAAWVMIRERDYRRLKGIDRFIPPAYTVFVRDIYTSRQVAGGIRAELGRAFSVIDWQDANKPLFSALALERKVALWIIFLITLVAVLNITTTLSLLVRERLPDIAVLRTCGATSRKLASIFLLEGWILSAVGIVLGLGTGAVFCAIANRFRLVSLPGEVYSLNFVPLAAEPFDFAVAAIATFALCTAAMAFPVLRASRARPLDIIRMK